MKEYTFNDVIQHRTVNDGWIVVHGKVYDITSFISKHPGGRVIQTSLGRDATALYETHHNLVENIGKVNSILAKYQIGTIKDYQPIADFHTPFAKEMLKRVREGLKVLKYRRESWYSHSALLFFALCLSTLLYFAFKTGNMLLTFPIGLFMAVGHLIGHAGNHWSLSEGDTINSLVSCLCTSLWGLREKNWEFSHLISHHCYNFTDRDYVLEQHLPMKFFRVKHSDPWTTLHQYQHIVYKFTPIIAFLSGAMRFDCFPWILMSPIAHNMKSNANSIIPAPKFFAYGSNATFGQLNDKEDGVGPEHFVVNDTLMDTAKSIVISNVIWLPLFLVNWKKHGVLHAILFNSFCFGIQAAGVCHNLLTQHLCEDIQLDDKYTPTDDWYAKQIAASTSVERAPIITWWLMAVSFQIEHHMFPCLNSKGLRIAQPIVHQVAKEYGVQYNYFTSNAEIQASVVRQLAKMGKKPENLSEKAKNE